MQRCIVGDHQNKPGQALALRRGRPITAPTYIPILGITDQTERNRICNRAASARFRQNQRQRDQELQT